MPGILTLFPGGRRFALVEGERLLCRTKKITKERPVVEPKDLNTPISKQKLTSISLRGIHVKHLLFAVALTISSTSFANSVLGSTISSTVMFEKGIASLSENSTTDIKQKVEAAKAMGAIREIKVISWADQEYPAKGDPAPLDAIKLAEARNDSIKRYLKSLNVGKMKSYNMAKRPNLVQELLYTGQAKVKDRIEVKGVAPTTDTSSTLDTSGKKSEALVLVYIKGKSKKL
jgi:hypothetical protein